MSRLRERPSLQPVGLDGNRDVFYKLFDGWAADMRGEHPEADGAIRAFLARHTP